MKALLYITISIFVIVEIKSEKFSKQDKDKCAPSPEIRKCEKGIYTPESCCKNVKHYYKLRMPNPDDCSSYYQCSKNRSVIIKCPKGLQWSIADERCEWPEDANCVAHGSSENEDSDEDENEEGSNEENILKNNDSDESGEVKPKKKRNDSDEFSESKELKKAVEMALKMIQK